MGYKIAIVGATGNVGREVLQILSERKFPADNVMALASARSAGREVSFGEDRVLKVQDLSTYDFSDTDIAFFAAGSKISQDYAPKAGKQGCVVIDKASCFRMDPDVPLIVPEINSDALKDYTRKNIVSTPNCSTIQMVLALKPLHDAAKIKRVVVDTYQSVSGAGKEGMDELFDQTKSIYANDVKAPQNFTRQIAFNVIPHIDDFMDNGMTKEEWKMVSETKKILGSGIKVVATCVRVPVFVGHAEAIHVEFENELSARDARNLLREAPGILVVDHRENNEYVTPLECVGEDAVFVSRLRDDPTVENGLSFWCVSDNLRKGAALNAVQIAETLVEKYLKNKAA